MKVSTSATATIAAAASFTYNLGKSLYIPLTSLCSTKTLPETRGSHFTLPSHVIQALMNVRQAEEEQSDLLNTNNKIKENTSLSLSSSSSESPRNSLAIPTQLPSRLRQEYKKSTLYPSSYMNFLENDLLLFHTMIDNPRMILHDHLLSKYDEDNTILLYPSRRTLLQQVLVEMNVKSHQEEDDDDDDHDHDDATTSKVDCIVFSGEGEPLLRYLDILFLSLSIRTEYPTIPIRIQTNGYITPLLRNNHTTTYDYTSVLFKLFKIVGVTHFTITLPTTLPLQYIEFMDPILTLHSHDMKEDKVECPLQQVYTFIQKCLFHKFHVEITSIDRPDVNKKSVENKARELGVVTPIRWRSYHP